MQEQRPDSDGAQPPTEREMMDEMMDFIRQRQNDPSDAEVTTIVCCINYLLTLALVMITLGIRVIG